MTERKKKEKKKRKKRRKKAALLEESLTSQKDKSMLTKSPRSYPVAF